MNNNTDNTNNSNNSNTTNTINTINTPKQPNNISVSDSINSLSIEDLNRIKDAFQRYYEGTFEEEDMEEEINLLLNFYSKTDINKMLTNSEDTITKINSIINKKNSIQPATKENKNIINPYFNCTKRGLNNIFINNFNALITDNPRKINTSFRNICKDQLIDAVIVYSYPLKEEYYIKINDTYKYIGNDYITYLKKQYNQIHEEIRELIPFSSFKNNIQIEETLKPNKEYILLNDCLLNIKTGKTEDIIITEDKIPFNIIEYDYKQENKEIRAYILDLLNRISESDLENENSFKGRDSTILSLLYGLFNREALGKGAVLNIQASNRGKTLLLYPFTTLKLFLNANGNMLERNKQEMLFRGYYCAVFEEIQDTLLNGGLFNQLVDKTDFPVDIKYKRPMLIDGNKKPAIIVNGETVPTFKGLTAGSLKRFRFMPPFKESLTEKDYEIITENYKAVAVEFIKIMLEYLTAVGIDTIKDNIKHTKKTEKELMELEENKIEIIFRYIKEDPEYKPYPSAYYITVNMLKDMIVELQTRGIITTKMFGSETLIKTWIRKDLYKNLETDIEYNEDKRKQITDPETYKTMTKRLKCCFQLTEKGKELITVLGYKLSELLIESKEI